MKIEYLIEKLEQEHILTKEEYITLLTSCDQKQTELLSAKARKLRERYYQKDV